MLSKSATGLTAGDEEGLAVQGGLAVSNEEIEKKGSTSRKGFGTNEVFPVEGVTVDKEEHIVNGRPHVVANEEGLGLVSRKGVAIEEEFSVE